MTLTVGTPDGLDAALLDVAREWLPERRWFPAKGTRADLELVGSLPLADDVRVLLVRARAGSIDAVLQVPLVLTAASPDAADAAETPDTPDPTVVGRVGDRVVRDGAAHPAFVAAWLAVADGPGADVDPGTARAVSGEQSNTSVILRATPDAPAPAAILKVLRAVAAGENPDVEVPRRLVEAGSTDVPAPLAWLEARWPDGSGGTVQGYLGAMSAFVEQAQDGFELACDVARRGEPFDAAARELGAVVAGVHAALVRAFGTDDATAPGDGPEQVAAAVANRFSWATSAVPQLARFAPGVDAVVAEVRALPAAPPRQRVHGDLHLGQVLRSGSRWFVTDFEGEPLAPLAARTRPDLALRDVAGMLRSLDYAAAVGGLTGPQAQAWTDSARRSLLDGYAAAAAPQADVDAAARAVLLRALELDKTLYEAVYESRNRPTWLPIPLAGLERLAG
ncbi:maltokinase N-terminal cap-like domain-containing protein [Cellulomonas fimi]|uniref:Maltokinase n=1 Tax=Cellulomonas fimi (strain ATCC 484 / DSM 20113 / JCM 1341 / CCUG 24087 / LMG 16345 / NBRC 15513 / NCIMB 8980 / NCTC 7547 / NRS-133) TaxID=590998 RepID=F4H7C6_CELFA|nr:aminoglycoside phosphotransferase [Cellulomonas fimi]AEE46887.1 aminoglycoside phosphotransferase [Cellulomonas fimi ATCC 484]NNH08815.1 aminoglycoside phosphotransferase [Cellulomonas fimi]VEH34469.1 Maltokinase [Cellulomonas fimi]